VRQRKPEIAGGRGLAEIQPTRWVTVHQLHRLKMNSDSGSTENTATEGRPFCGARIIGIDQPMAAR